MFDSSNSFFCSNFQKLGADLIAIETESEQDFTRRTVNEIDGKKRPFWIIGGKRTGKGKNFFWVQTGKPLAFQTWHGGYPLFNNDETVYLFLDVEDGRKWWDDHKRHGIQNVICEKSL